MRISIGIQNPSNESFQIKSFVGNLFAAGTDNVPYKVGTVSSFESLYVPAAAQVVYPLYIRLNLLGIVSDIFNTIQQGSGPSHTVTLEGTVNASGIVAPVSLTYKIL